MTNNYEVGSIVVMKKGHPCGTNGRVVMLPRIEFNKKLKKVIEVK